MAADRPPTRAPPARAKVPAAQANKGTVAKFAPAILDKVIQSSGLTFRWSRGLPCPCRSPETDQPAVGCELCIGTGWHYVNPNAVKERHATRDHAVVACGFAQAMERVDLFEALGAWVFGDAVLTAQNDMKVGLYDRFVGMEQEMAWAEIRVRLAEDAIPIGLTGRTTLEQRGALRYEPVAINYLRTRAATYWERVDYTLRAATLTEPSRVQWKPGRGPAVGERYSIHYICRPVWVVTDGMYAIQSARGPAQELAGLPVVQALATSFKVTLDYLPRAQGS